MACFIVPASEAVITTIASHVVKKKEEKKVETENVKIPFSQKLGWLNKLLTGGSLLLAFEHVWHGEVVPYFPFLSAMASEKDTAEMLYEMGTVGVAMAAVCTVAWLGMVAFTHVLEKKKMQVKTEEADV